LLVLIVAACLAGGALAQTTRRAREDPNSFRVNPKMAAAFSKVVAAAGKSVVRILVDDHDAALGTVVSPDGYILTKHSEIAHDGEEADIQVRLSDGRTLPAEVTGTEPKLDLVMLKVKAQGLLPVEWRDSKSALVGDLLATPGADGKPLAVGIVSVATRKTRAVDLPPVTPPANAGFLGVSLEEGEGGARIVQVVAGGAAEKAGLEEGDIVTAIAGTAIIDAETMVNTIQRHKPGEVVSIHFKRDGKEMQVEATLGKRTPENGRQRDRRDFQNRLGGELSDRRGGFPAVLQHDTVLKPTDCGGPVVDLDGKVIGLNIARAGRVESYALPAEEISPVIEKLKSGGGAVAMTPVSTPATKASARVGPATKPTTKPAKPPADRSDPFSDPGR
jgi:serine protease Do